MSAVRPNVSTVPPRTYREAGVDLDGKAALLRSLGPLVRSTLPPEAAGFGDFAGTLRLPAGLVLAVTTDGVGTKALLARRCGRDRVVGADAVYHCANDLAAAGARPLLFADYLAMGRLDERVVTAVVEGMAAACRALGIPLLAGETAEMPDTYREDAYDVVGTMVGLVDELPHAGPPRPGDVVLGLAADGLHTNGYSLARRLVADVDLNRYDPALGATPADALLAPHRCYATALASLRRTVPVRAAAHITGGGLAANLVRVLPPDAAARLDPTWPVPPVFRWLQRRGAVAEEEMCRVFNMGIGMAVIVPPERAAAARDHLEAAGERCWVIGHVETGQGEVRFG